MSKPGVSVVICTYNGASKLPDTIKHIAFQKVPPHIPWEFIIIDNTSTDGTGDVALDEWNRYSCNTEFRIIRENQPGLSYARSKGFASARYDYVLLCDDDNWLDDRYVELVYEIMTQHTSIGVLGGNGELVFEEEPPAWIKAFSIYAGGPQAEESGAVYRNTVYGAGCVVRKSAYELIRKAGFRSLLTDRLGKELSSGGDYELCYALAMAGFKIWYDDRLTFKHLITKDRLTKKYYLKYLHESSTCFGVLEPYKIICERRFLSFRSFRYMTMKILFYFLRKYVWITIKRFFYKKDSVQHTILSLRSYSVRSKILVFLRNRKIMYESYNHGKTLQQKFAKPAVKKAFATPWAFLSSINRYYNR